LAHAHSHLDAKGRPAPIVHRDVTPRNIMLGFDGATKMLDFGIARAMGTQRRTVAGMVRGTTAYMSPEQAIGKDVNPQSDIFSLGVIFHELLTGQRLFARSNPGEEMAAVYEGEVPLPSKVNRRVPKPLDAVVMRALERPKDKRYQSGLELIRDISLTVGSTAWAHDRCGDAVRERFSHRERDIEKLLAAIPLLELGVRPKAIAPEPATLIATISQMTGLPDATDEQTTLKTHGSLRTTDPGQGPTEEPRRPRRASQGPPAATEFDPAEPTYIVAPSGPEDPDAKTRPAKVVQRKRTPQKAAPGARHSLVVIVMVGLVAIALGVAGGLLIAKQVARNDATAFGKLTIGSDRPAEVLLGSQSLGMTPVSDLLLPAGRHHLVLKEAAGSSHWVEVQVNPTELTKVEVELDWLPVVK
jgi:hypothetical protein